MGQTVCAWNKDLIIIIIIIIIIIVNPGKLLPHQL